MDEIRGNDVVESKGGKGDLGGYWGVISHAIRTIVWVIRLLGQPQEKVSDLIICVQVCISCRLLRMEKL